MRYCDPKTGEEHPLFLCFIVTYTPPPMPPLTGGLCPFGCVQSLGRRSCTSSDGAPSPSHRQETGCQAWEQTGRGGRGVVPLEMGDQKPGVSQAGSCKRQGSPTRGGSSRCWLALRLPGAPSSLAGSWGGSIPGPAQAGEAEAAEWLDPPRPLSPEPDPAPQLMSSRWIGIGATPTASGPPGPGSAQCGGGYAACQAVTHNGLDAPGPALSFMI